MTAPPICVFNQFKSARYSCSKDSQLKRATLFHRRNTYENARPESDKCDSFSDLATQFPHSVYFYYKNSFPVLTSLTQTFVLLQNHHCVTYLVEDMPVKKRKPKRDPNEGDKRLPHGGPPAHHNQEVKMPTGPKRWVEPSLPVVEPAANHHYPGGNFPQGRGIYPFQASGPPVYHHSGGSFPQGRGISPLQDPGTAIHRHSGANFPQGRGVSPFQNLGPAVHPRQENKIPQGRGISPFQNPGPAVHRHPGGNFPQGRGISTFQDTGPAVHHHQEDEIPKGWEGPWFSNSTPAAHDRQEGKVSQRWGASHLSDPEPAAHNRQGSKVPGNCQWPWNPVPAADHGQEGKVPQRWGVPHLSDPEPAAHNRQKSKGPGNWKGPWNPVPAADYGQEGKFPKGWQKLDPGHATRDGSTEEGRILSSEDTLTAARRIPLLGEPFVADLKRITKMEETTNEGVVLPNMEGKANGKNLL